MSHKEIKMQNIGAYEAKTHLPKLIERVMKGERITITKHGVPVAVLQSPPDTANKSDIRNTIDELREFRKKCRLDGLSIRELIDEGRR